MDILNKIIASKHREVAIKKQLVPESLLPQFPLFSRQTVSLAERLQDSTSGIIAEHKRRSPSRSAINTTASLPDIIKAYEIAGVCGMSILTDTPYFGGSLDDLLVARSLTGIPLLRKDFILDPYQVLEAKAYGADVVLLIAAALSPRQIKELTRVAQSLQLEVLLEVHNKEELLANLDQPVDFIGVNNRNLKTFRVDLGESEHLASLIPDNTIKISESGIDSPEAIAGLRRLGYRGFLIGTHFMKHDAPGAVAGTLINAIEDEN